MMPLRCLFVCLLTSALAASPADRVTVTVTHEFPGARPSETITIPWSEINRVLPGAFLQRIAVKDAKGNMLPYQVTNVAPEAKDPNGVGVAYGELIFQHDFTAGEKSAVFTVEKTETVSPVFPSKVFARYIPERLDDFAWENDKLAHRTYGPALAEARQPGTNKEVLVTSGLDIWCKRVDYLIVDRWYNKGHDHYHHDEGEGMDMYNVGTSRGAGGTGVWDGKQLYGARNFKTWKVIANGPIRAIFELSYEPWTAGGAIVSEIKRFTVDAGHNFDQIESTFVAETGSKTVSVAVGLNKDSGDKGQNNVVTVTKGGTEGWLSQWEVQKTNGSLGEGIIVPADFDAYAEDSVNQLVIAHATSGQPLRYYVGAGWSKAGEFTTRESWEACVAAYAARIKSPIKITLTP